MVIIGAGGLAKQILDVVERLNLTESILFFDNLTKYTDSPNLFGYTILQNQEELVSVCKIERHSVILGVSNPHNRKTLYNLYREKGINFRTIIASSVLLGKNDVEIGEGVILLEGVIIESSAKIGKGALVNTSAKIFHDAVIGDFCEIAPGCNILGKVKIRKGTLVGAGATILPGIEVGENVRIGAGAVVTKNVPDNAIVKGIPGQF